MAARLDPRHVRPRHQSMHHLVADAPWADAAMVRIARDVILTEMDGHGRPRLRLLPCLGTGDSVCVAGAVTGR